MRPCSLRGIAWKIEARHARRVRDARRDPNGSKKLTQDDVAEWPTRNPSASPRQRRHRALFATKGSPGPLPKSSPTPVSLKCFSDIGSERHDVSFRCESGSPPVLDGRDGSRSCGRCWIFFWRSRESDLERSDTTVPRQ